MFVITSYSIHYTKLYEEDCNYLKVTKKGQPTQIYSRGTGVMGKNAGSYSRVPAGHPEGFYEAYGNIYSSFCSAVIDKQNGKKMDRNNFV